jgi:hypothetical protein
MALHTGSSLRSDLTTSISAIHNIELVEARVLKVEWAAYFETTAIAASRPACGCTLLQKPANFVWNLGFSTRDLLALSNMLFS